MPHVIVKLVSGRSEQQLVKLAEEVSKAVVMALDCSESAVSVAIEAVESSDWTEKVYKPDIVANIDRIYKKPGYKPF